MTDIQTSLFNNQTIEQTGGVTYKSYLLKRKIIFELASRGDLTVTDLSVTLNVSNPTISKLISDLIADGYVRDMGKIETPGGRRPCSYGLIASAGYFVGVDIADEHLNFQIIDMVSQHVAVELAHPFTVRNDYATIDRLAAEINTFIQNTLIDSSKILGIGIIIRGRVDSSTGHSYNLFNFDTRPFAELMTVKTGVRTVVENDTRAMAYAEWNTDEGPHPKNALFVNIGRGVGVGIIIDGQLYYGKSGFSGEFGHIPFFDNQTICHCGKKGCLETEASGAALERNFVAALEKGASSILSEQYKKRGMITLADIVEAAAKDDVLCIELITSVGEKLGRGIGVLINLFNPELVVIGGMMAAVGDYLMLPIRTALNKYSLSLVNRDSQLRLSALGESAGVIGAALLARNRILEIE